MSGRKRSLVELAEASPLAHYQLQALQARVEKAEAELAAAIDEISFFRAQRDTARQKLADLRISMARLLTVIQDGEQPQ